MPIALLMFLLFLPAQSWAGWLWGQAEEDVAQVQVTEPYIEWRTGPATGYPVFHTSEKGEWLTILQRKTSWIKVTDARGREGWVAVADIAQTVDGTGNRVDLQVPDFDSFGNRRVEAGLMMGEFDGAAVTAGYGGLWMTRNLSAELWASQILGSASEIRMVNANLVHQPFPHWRVSPFFTLGVGHIWVDPKATLAQPEERDNSIGHAGLGIRAYITDRYFIRAEVKDYKVFTTRSTNEEATEWKIGLSIFF
jgi:hypothetical protein